MSIYYNDIDPYCCKVLRARIADGLLPQGDVDETDIRSVSGDTLRRYQQLHLFAGIGGFPLGMRMAGFPEDISVITGGFPCQDVSVGGRQAGLNGQRSTLWFEYYRIIRDLRPQWVLAENVCGILSNESGRFFGRVLSDLANGGYHATWQVLCARDFGAPHLRQRVFIVANRNSQRIKGFWKRPLPKLPEFSWCQNVRSVEDLRNRSDIPEPLVRRNSHGISPRMDKPGNAVVPGIVGYICTLMMAAEDYTEIQVISALSQDS